MAERVQGVRRAAVTAGAALSLGALFLVACADDGPATLGVDAYVVETTGAHPTTPGPDGDAAPAPSDGDAVAEPEPTMELAAPSYDESGCLTGAGAERVCAGACGLVVRCKALAGDQDCRSACAGAAAARCLTARDVECLREARAVDACKALARCPLP